MASVSKQVLISTKVGERGKDGERRCSWNQRQEDFVIFTKLIGKPVKPFKVHYETSPNGEDWARVHDVEVKGDDKDFFVLKTPMLAQFRVVYDEGMLLTEKGSGKNKTLEKVADLHCEVCYKDAR